jgi:predicted PurR-regulated permease PerM
VDPGSTGTRTEPLTQRSARRLLITLVLAALVVLLLATLAGKLRDFFDIILLSLFLSFAIEPAVNWLARHGWRRGLATGAVFVGVAGALTAVFLLIVPVILHELEDLATRLPELLSGTLKTLNKWLGTHFSEADLQAALARYRADVAKYLASLADNVLGVVGGFVAALFKWSTIAFFTFYLVTDAPRLRRALCSRLPPARQHEVTFIWETAIQQTGGYFYSRLLLAIVNGSLTYLVLRLLSVPFAAALATFVGIVAAFIPTVGTYIAGAVPVLIALLTDPLDAVWLIVWFVLYQQMENIWLSPRLTAKTMSLHPAIAFAAAFIGGSIGGIVAAFLALPAAGVIQAAIQTYTRRYEVLESDMVAVQPPEVPDEAPPRWSWKELRRRMGRPRQGHSGEPSGPEAAGGPDGGPAGPGAGS